MKKIRFIALRDISVGLEFQKIDIETQFIKDYYDIDIYLATPLFGFDSKGKMLETEKFVLLGDGGVHVEEFYEAQKLANVKLFKQNEEIESLVNPCNIHYRNKQFKSLSDFINNKLQEVYLEICNEN